MRTFLVCPSRSTVSVRTPTRVGYRIEEIERDGRKKTVRIRVAKRSGKDI